MPILSFKGVTGIAKLRFCASLIMNDTTPITSPALLNRGPPLLPDETGAVI
ncbi:MAG: hypothetical protein N2202_09955 [Proteobacteria bacterium]|nr:hypothetical protein [Pseudomonadota bacterium]